MDAAATLLDELIASGLLVPSGEDGLYGRGAIFETVVAGVESAAVRAGAGDAAQILRFPPVMPRSTFERSGYMKGFPQLAGTIHSFSGGDREHISLLDKLERGEDWCEHQAPTGCVMVPAACYPLYPALARAGHVAENGPIFDLQSYCFRHEPSKDPSRMQIFRMREFVRAGTAAQAREFRDSWVERAEEIAAKLELPFEVVPASDPFFGRAGRLMKSSQSEQGLKHELTIPVAGLGPTACASFNYHQDHFSEIWGLARDDGEPVHTACVGFGLERWALALFRHHGVDPDRWPAPVRSTLWDR